MLIFIVILLVCYIYPWNRGARLGLAVRSTTRSADDRSLATW